ncbi:hypothetical protein [Xanthomonas cucurbitae]|uniref:hypothetical protein n=1 Tax=Xanthomonas cucurbitae TaxID=56453 RepID=UPI002368951A|nr:hypothetical protein [Xanthomonas cucurbitae]
MWYDADGNMLPGGLGSSWSSGNVVDSGSDGRWHQSSVTATVPPGAAFMTIGASALKGAGGDPLWVDDFQWTYTPVEPGIKELPVDKAYWFEYDKENRVTVSNGMLQDGQIVVANDDTSSLQSYDADGRLISQSAYGIPMGGVYQPVDEDGNPLPLPDDLEGLQLLSVVNYQDGTLATGYDAAGRLRGYWYLMAGS